MLKKLRPDINVDSAGTSQAIPVSEDAKKYLLNEEAEQYLKKAPEGLYGKQLHKYDIIVAMEPMHRDAVLSECHECADKIVTWNIEDPYFLPHGHSEKVFKQIKDKVLELAESL